MFKIEVPLHHSTSSEQCHFSMIILFYKKMLQIHVRKLIQFCHKIDPEYIAKISNSFMPANKKANCSVSLLFASNLRILITAKTKTFWLLKIFILKSVFKHKNKESKREEQKQKGAKSCQVKSLLALLALH